MKSEDCLDWMDALHFANGIKLVFDSRGKYCNTITRKQILKNYIPYTTLTNFSTKYLVMCKVYTDVGGIK